MKVRPALHAENNLLNHTTCMIRISTLILALLLCFTAGNAQRKKKNTKEKPAPDLSETYQGLKWRNIGPFRGGRSVAVAGVPGDPMTYFMGTTGGGVWKTTDGGISWKNISDGQLNSGTVGDIAIAPSDHNVIYLGMGEHAVRGVMTSAGDGVYRSTDFGKTWKHIGLENSQHISDIVVHPDNPDVAYVAVQGALYGDSEDRGIYKTTDGGKSWEKKLFINGSTGASGLEMDPSNPRILYAAMWDHQRTPWFMRSGGPGSGIHKSTDGGDTWTPLTEGLPAEMGKVGLAVSAANPDRVYALIEAEDKQGGVYRSDDGGKKWQQVNSDRVNIARAWYYIEIEADPQNQEVVYVMNSPLTKSVDGGKTFQNIPVPHVDTHDLWINPDNPLNFINANDGGGTITFNGGATWSTQENQPTAQFYRVIADKRFPYYLYSGQQDNSAIAIPSQSLTGPGIGWKDWYSVAGGESAYLAFDPENPDVTYGSSIQGFINRYTHSLGTSKDINVYPEFVLGKEPLEMKYRFNWNPPLKSSIHNPDVMYYGAQHLLKTTDGGISWTEASLDLTRNQKERQGPGGGPYTNEAAGGENYNTIMYFAESPHTPEVIYVGSDDGLVHVTRDGGNTWENVTPSGMPEAIVNAIEVSPHDPGTAYLAVMRYKYNDFRPYAYKTTDYGQTWSEITGGIEQDHFVRVIREDKKTKDLLYAGTEKGIYLSRDGGNQWQKFQLNFPQVPVTDLYIAENDLTAATAGRGFWILDDLNAVQQGGNLGENTILFQPEKSIKVSVIAPPVPVPNLGQNPMNGAVIDYYLPADSMQVKILIHDQDKNLLRTYASYPDSTKKPVSGAPPAELLPNKKGVNRTGWDLRKEPIDPVENQFVFGDYAGHMISPGTYFVTLVSGDDSLTSELEVVRDPRIEFPANAFDRQQEMLNEIDDILVDMISSINEMKKAKKQINSWNEFLGDDASYDTLRNYGKVVLDSLDNWEQNLVQVRHKTFQDVVNMPSRLASEFMFLKGYLESHDPIVTKGAEERFEDLKGLWKEQKDELDYILEELLPDYNRLFKERDVPALLIEK